MRREIDGAKSVLDTVLSARPRKGFSENGSVFSGPVETDETYIGGRRKNMSNAKRKELADTARGRPAKLPWLA